MNTPARRPAAIGSLARQVVIDCALARERRWQIEQMLAAIKRTPGLPSDVASSLDRIEHDILNGSEFDPGDAAGVRALFDLHVGIWSV